jgi:response regulator RpfG family c-di-GMP phosphodiesterase
MLVDDSADDNFFHEREIMKQNSENIVVTKNTGAKALDYLKSKDMHPDLIFLDINMPGMNGWDFLNAYDKLDRETQSRAIIIMLTTSDSSADKDRAKQWNFVSDYITKPLTREIMKEISDKYFNTLAQP